MSELAKLKIYPKLNKEYLNPELRKLYYTKQEHTLQAMRNTLERSNYITVVQQKV